MKRIVLIVCGLLLLVANTAEARRSRRGNYSQPMQAAPANYSAPIYSVPAAQPTRVAPSAHTTTTAAPVRVTPASYVKSSPQPAPVVDSGLHTRTAQGVANIMAARGQVGHWGGNPSYEGCGMAATPQAAYSICCYANSGMATVDVGYAQGANGMWYCCRRYR